MQTRNGKYEFICFAFKRCGLWSVKPQISDYSSGISSFKPLTVGLAVCAVYVDTSIRPLSACICVSLVSLFRRSRNKNGVVIVMPIYEHSGYFVGERFSLVYRRAFSIINSGNHLIVRTKLILYFKCTTAQLNLMRICCHAYYGWWWLSSIQKTYNHLYEIWFSLFGSGLLELLVLLAHCLPISINNAHHIRCIVFNNFSLSFWLFINTLSFCF